MTTAQYHRLRLHVSATNRDVVRAASQMIAPWHRRSREVRAERHAFYRSAIERHEAARDLFAFVARGA